MSQAKIAVQIIIIIKGFIKISVLIYNNPLI